jgi:glycosyltransferase involved in cell wall biosynthesis
VDDGSTDNSAEIYTRYARQDPRIKIVKQPNQGPAAARNTGLEQVSGDYIHFMDSDDHLIEADYYEKLLFAALDSGADLACSGFFLEDKWHTHQHSRRILTDIDEKISLVKLNFCVWIYLFSTALVKRRRLRFDVSLYVAEDMLFSVAAVYYARKIALAPETTYYHRNNSASISRNLAPGLEEKKQRGLRLAWEKIRAFSENHYLGREFEDFFLWRKKRIFKYKFFQITFLKKVVSLYKISWYLFGFLPVLAYIYVKELDESLPFSDPRDWPHADRGFLG